jgi:hypothetical protein
MNKINIFFHLLFFRSERRGGFRLGKLDDGVSGERGAQKMQKSNSARSGNKANPFYFNALKYFTYQKATG